MRTINVAGTELIREALDTLEDNDIASGRDFDVYYVDIMGEDGETISEAVVHRFDFKYVNTEVEHERELELDATRNEWAAIQSLRAVR